MSTGKYDDILYEPHHQSRRHPHMPNAERAAQFSPFAALSGHEDRIAETAQIAFERAEHEIIHIRAEGDDPWIEEGGEEWQNI